ncbi:MAG: BspA family leucine-rich repeat surface protein [Prevotella sp.]|nr:BspA family leucine-rich repeat surface protein [Prevotella sp.]
MKKILFLLLCILAGAQTMKAQRAYAFFYEDQQVLKFFYDNQLTDRLNNPQQKPDNYYTAFYSQALGDQPAWYWDNNNAKIKTVNFDSSFKDYKPYKLSYFFAGMIQLSSIINIQFLNTSETTNMQGMFAGCSAITRLDFYYLNTQNVVNFNDMFNGCKKLILYI